MTLSECGEYRKLPPVSDWGQGNRSLQALTVGGHASCILMLGPAACLKVRMVPPRGGAGRFWGS